jgi:hypothetical protein
LAQSSAPASEGAKPKGDECHDRFAALLKHVAEQDPAALQHKVAVINGRAFVKIGQINRDEQRFMKLLLAAIKRGDVAEIDAGSIDGPKVLNVLAGISSRARKDKPVTITGRLEMADLIDTMKSERIMAENPETFGDASKNPAFQWSLADTSDFFTAAHKLKIPEACRKLFRQTNLSACGRMEFQFSTDHPERIEWRIARDRD